MSPGVPELRRAWAVLSAPTREELTTFPLEVSVHGLACRVALGRAGERHLLVPAGDENPAAASRVGTLATTVRRLTFGDTTSPYVDVACADAGVFEQFDEVVADVLGALVPSAVPAQTTLETIERWRALFRSRLLRGLGAQEVRGLFAELVVLDALVTHAPQMPVGVWTGPLRRAHDFELADRCLEVKALGVTSETVVIHGLSQLEVHDGRGLDLVLVHVVEDDDGLGIADLVERIGRTTSPQALRPLLDAAGWTNTSQGPDEDKFVVAEVLRVPVGVTTPRLVEALLSAGAAMDGVVRVTYEIQREALLPHVVGSSLQAVVAGAAR